MEIVICLTIAFDTRFTFNYSIHVLRIGLVLSLLKKWLTAYLHIYKRDEVIFLR